MRKIEILVFMILFTVSIQAEASNYKIDYFDLKDIKNAWYSALGKSEVQLIPVSEAAFPEKTIKSKGETIHSNWNNWIFNGNQWRVVNNMLVGGGGQGNGSVWLQHYEEPVSVKFDFYTDNPESEAILFIYGNGRNEKDGYSFTLNPKWSSIRKNSFKGFLAFSKDDSFKLKPNKWYKMKAVVTGDGTMNFSVDRTAAKGNFLVASDNSYKGGAIGFMVWWQAQGKRLIKNVTIERLKSHQIVTAFADRALVEKKPASIDKSRVATRASGEERSNIPLIKDPNGIAVFILLVCVGLIAAGKLIG